MVAIVCNTDKASAYLGGFEEADGYINQGTRAGVFDISRYNAGKLVSLDPLEAEPFQATAAYGGAGISQWSKHRGAEMSINALPWQQDPPGSGVSPVYATSHNAFPAIGFHPKEGERSLIITSNNQGWDSEPQEYRYQLDEYDFGAIISTDDTGVDVSFWSCAFIAGVGDTGAEFGLNKAGVTGNSIGFADALGSVGIEVGYIQPIDGDGGKDNFAYKAGGDWVDTGIEVPNIHGWHRWDVSVNWATDKVSIGLVGAPGESPMSLIENLDMGEMGALTELRFTSTPGVINSKTWALDDFNFSVVPEPNSSVLGFVAAMGLLACRRRQA